MISFVGAGPGAADLMTFRGADRLARADVVVWASSLVPAEVLTHANPAAQRHDSAGMTLEDVLEVYAGHPDATIVRLHSGDPTVYGAIGEQIAWCRLNGRPYEIVPGVGSLGAAAAAVGCELTSPTVSQSVVLTRLAGGRTAASMPDGETVASFAAHRTTMAVYLSAQRPEQLQAELLADGEGYSPDTPAVVVAKATWPDERIVRTTVGELAAELRASGIRTAALVLVGEALDDEREVRRTRLYDPAYSHGCRRRSTEGSTHGRPIPVEKRRLP
jgi:precorrin-4/cobalt-precorrin-4 C11-methyltransferase